jgi:hypothetical protein
MKIYRREIKIKQYRKQRTVKAERQAVRLTLKEETR